jgi:hypothetical protein
VKKLASLSIILISMVMLYGCKSGKGATGPRDEDPVVVGSAKLYLPVLPKDFLAKNAASPTKAMFVLTISGSGMVTRKQAWPLSSSSGVPVQVNNIPVGARLFVGQLDVDGVITHADSAWARIEGGKTTQVNLKLASASGNAVICVEIEGAPMPAACKPVNNTPDLSGCYQINVTGGFGTATGYLGITQRDSLLTGIITWSDGGRDTSVGMVFPGGSFMFGLSGAPTAWSFKSMVKLDNPKGGFGGSGFYHSRRNFFGNFTAAPSFCVNQPPPMPGVETAFNCFVVSQSFEGGIQTSGRLAVVRMGAAAYGVFQWSGHGVAAGKGMVDTADGGNLTLRLDVPVPASIHPNPGGNLLAWYTATLSPGIGLFDGQIHRPGDMALGAPIGSWMGYSRTCDNEDRKLVQAQFGI